MTRVSVRSAQYRKSFSMKPILVSIRHWNHYTFWSFDTLYHTLANMVSDLLFAFMIIWPILATAWHRHVCPVCWISRGSSLFFLVFSRVFRNFLCFSLFARSLCWIWISFQTIHTFKSSYLFLLLIPTIKFSMLPSYPSMNMS